MGNLNKVLLIGFLGQDPEKRVTSGGHSVVSVNLARTERFNDKEGNRQERTEWHRLVFWNQKADFIEQYCKKGTQLYVEGSLQTREWLDKDGNKRYSTEIVVRNSQLLDRMPAGQGNQSNYQAGNQANQAGGQYQQQPPVQDQQQAPTGNAASGGQMNQQFQEPPPGPSQPKVTPGTDDFIEDDIPF